MPFLVVSELLRYTKQILKLAKSWVIS
jgi:hypothetical protein